VGCDSRARTDAALLNAKLDLHIALALLVLACARTCRQAWLPPRRWRGRASGRAADGAPCPSKPPQPLPGTSANALAAAAARRGAAPPPASKPRGALNGCQLGCAARGSSQASGVRHRQAAAAHRRPRMQAERTQVAAREGGARTSSSRSAVKPPERAAAEAPLRRPATSRSPSSATPHAALPVASAASAAARSHARGRMLAAGPRTLRSRRHGQSRAAHADDAAAALQPLRDTSCSNGAGSEVRT